MSDPITINIKSSGDKKYEVSISPSELISALKQEVAKVSDVPAETQRLIYSGRVLKDEQTVESYNIQNGHTLHLVGSRKTAAPAAAPAAATPESNNIPSGIAAGQGLSPLNDLTSARYAGYGAQMPDVSLLLDASGGLPSEDQLEQLISDPAFGSSMQMMLNNPQMLDMMIQQNPMMRGMDREQVRSMMSSPFVQSMLSNPQMMRSMMSMQRGAGGPASSFPMPGSATGTTSTAGEAPANPFSAFLGANSDAATGVGAGANPFDLLRQMGGMGGNSTNAGAANPYDLLQQFGGMGGAPAPVDDTPPEVRYEAQLRQLNDMGFFEFDSNVQALRRSGGSVQGAIEHLLNN
ncbi:hypothetical protein BABINDRAFT_5954 [Babjeviella inositovora NRRL Y-12698]|uniref:Ubiquitin-like domain-containing protein n=1 Tax=Babjeviella inositovora NRRL Y-12698 TaxID=984486 RepID=A0A1E3R124_9ASCO|nr:uncharacterized protein BABINDRAFT_5954 [Babjeviella inositovora NRRL Y-12698]ODQ83087.1 hypothetical protein BABINDRAFT_5954 [Babjeviella inositovora NRRL Y-12698]